MQREAASRPPLTRPDLPAPITIRRVVGATRAPDQKPNGRQSLAEHTSIAGGTQIAIRVIEILCMVVHSAVASPVPAWERDYVSDGLDTSEIAQQAVEADAKAAMRRAAPAAEVDVPVKTAAVVSAF